MLLHVPKNRSHRSSCPQRIDLTALGLAEETPKPKLDSIFCRGRVFSSFFMGYSETIRTLAQQKKLQGASCSTGFSGRRVEGLELSFGHEAYVDAPLAILCREQSLPRVHRGLSKRKMKQDP